MRSAVIVVDMVADYFREEQPLPITGPALDILPAVNRLIRGARAAGSPVVFACDSFLPDDFLFRGKMAPHSLRGTPGSEPTKLLDRDPDDIVLPKRRFSAFFKTDLDQTLRTLGVEAVAVVGITTQVCVLATALDAIALDFHAAIVEDACAAHRPEVHLAVLDVYRNTPLFPLLRVTDVEGYLSELGPQDLGQR